MKTQNIVFRMVLTLISALVVASCSKDEAKSAKAEVTILPEKPIVITADITSNGTVIKAPWFEFRAKMANATEEKITIIALQVTVTGLDESGTNQKTNVAIAPSEFNFALNDEVMCEFTYFGEFAVSETKFLTLEGALNACYETKTLNEGTPQESTVRIDRVPMFRIASNPVGGPQKSNFNYNVELKPLGWFGGRDLPSDRFDKTVTFYTE